MRDGGPMGGDVTIEIDGVKRPARLTLGALAELEMRLGDEGLVPLLVRFEGGTVKSRDVLALIVAGLRGGGWDGGEDDLLTAQIGGGAAGAARQAAALLMHAFKLPQ